MSNTSSTVARNLLVALSPMALSLASLAFAQGPPPPPPPGGGGGGNPPPALPLPPQVPTPGGNPFSQAKANLGKMLFWEEQMSSNNRVACGTCHLPSAGGGDPRRVVNPGGDGITPSADDIFGSPGVPSNDTINRYQPHPRFGFQPQVTGRASPSAITSAWFDSLFWDGRAEDRFVNPETGLTSLFQNGALESQAVAPILDNTEMGHDNRTWAQATSKLVTAIPMALATNLPADVSAALASNPTYPDLFTAAFGDPAITAERIAFAIATYERTLVPNQSPYDQFAASNQNALTAAQVRGWLTFTGPGRCNRCHTPGLFSDRQFRNLGLRPLGEDRGRQIVTGNPADAGKFKVPSLRNSGLRSSFMHNGQFTSMQQVINFYANGGGPNPQNRDPLLQALGLNGGQRADLADFVANALTDPRVANEQFPFDRPTLRSELLPVNGDLFGFGTAGSGGFVPNMLAGVPANIGNIDFKVGVSNAMGSAGAILAVASQAAPPFTFVGGTLVLVDMGSPLIFPLTTSGPAIAGQGFATVQFPLPNDTALRGLQVFAQWFVFDPKIAAIAASSQAATINVF